MKDAAPSPACRFCQAPLTETFVDLGPSPLCESFLAADQLERMEPFYPLHVRVCGDCFLVQLEAYVPREAIFTEYAYFSSYSTSWLDHARCYVDMAVERFALDRDSLVVEVASNDGYLLRHFEPYGIPVLGIEPARNVAEVAQRLGIETLTEFFGVDLARSLVASRRQADLIIGNNVLAQVPDLNDFVAGLRIALAPAGTITLEFPHLERLVAGTQFDTIYHEHFSYFSLHTVDRIFAAHGLTIFDVEELPTHGGSLRIHVRHADQGGRPVTGRTEAILARERTQGITEFGYYRAFEEKVKRAKRRLLSFLIDARESGRTVAGYGAPGKGNTLLNYCGIRTDLLAYTVDRNPYKQGKYLPGTRIPILGVDQIARTRPDFLLILPWNLEDEIVQQTRHIRDWGGRHVRPIPEVEILT